MFYKTPDTLHIGLAAATCVLAYLWRRAEGRLARVRFEADLRIKTFEEKMVFMQAAQETNDQALQRASSGLLVDHKTHFSDLARRALEAFSHQTKQELTAHGHDFRAVANPLATVLEGLKTHVQALEKDRIGAYAGLHQTVKELMSETQTLANALHTPKTKGLWGEMQLRRVLELAGMERHCDFEEQVAPDDGKRIRPDVVVRLPQNRCMIIDSKAPLTHYLEALSASDPSERQRAAQNHVRLMRAHVQRLGAKEYAASFPTAPDFVVLFVPNESFFSFALEWDSELVAFGVDYNVIIATPTTLIALLRTVAAAWKHENMETNARRIGELGQTLHGHLSAFLDTYGQLGRRLSDGVKHYNQGLETLENDVVGVAKAFHTLGLVAEPLAAPAQIKKNVKNAETPCAHEN